MGSKALISAFAPELTSLPFTLKRAPVTIRTECVEEVSISRDCPLDKIPCRRLKDRPSFFVISVQEPGPGPALQRSGKLPAKVYGILETGVDAIATIGRMAVCRITGNEDAALPVSICRGNPKLPEPDMLELDVELCPYCGMEILPEVEIILCRPEWDRRMEEPRRSEIHPAEEFPVSLQFRIEDIVV